MNTPEDKSPSAVTPVNRRITWLILGFAFLSLAASVLPLLPGIDAVLPFELLERRGALTLYSVFLVAYMAMVFPTTLLATQKNATREEADQQALGWWWVGSFMLAFSGVPLFVLAYIAGVSLKGVFAVLLWAGFFHGLATLWPRLFGFGSRPVLVIGNFLLLVVMPTLNRFGELLGVGARASTPFSIVSGITRDFQQPDLVLPGILMGFVYLALWGFCLGKKGGRAVKAALLLATVTTFGFVAAGRQPTASESAPATLSQSARVVSLTQGYHTSGRVFPMRLTGQPGQSVVVDIAGRDEITWRCPETAGATTWIYPSLLPGDDRIRVKTTDGGSLAEVAIEPLPPTKNLVLFLGGIQPQNSDDWLGLAHQDIQPLLTVLAYDPFGAVVCPESYYDGLKKKARRALNAWVRRGGVLMLLEAGSNGESQTGAGRILTTTGKNLAENFRPPTRGRRAEDANLYSNFLLPDWGQVDLSGLLLFLCIYHAVFYVIFLLPLVLDSGKSLGVYLCSVGFVLTLCVVGAYYTLKKTFLTENQILQQNVCTWRIPTTEGASLELDQESCFASFNGQAENLVFDTRLGPTLVHATDAPKGVRMGLSPDGRRLELKELALDRFAGKQVLKLSKIGPSPFKVEAQGRTVKLRPRAGISDEFGLVTARMRTAFYRYDGRLYPAEFRGNVIEVGSEPDSLIWQGVLPRDMRDANIVPFLRHSLGHHAGRKENVLVILVEGARGLHPGDSYLARRDILQALFIGIDLQMK